MNRICVITCWTSAVLLSTSLMFGQGQKRYRDEVFASYHVQPDVPYGQVLTQSLHLDVYTGSGDTATNRPLVIFIHGGGFRTGDKSAGFAKLACGALARRGYVAASINYRLTPTYTNDTACFEAMLRALHDAKAAVRFFRKEGSTYGVDTLHIYAAGSSAGSITALHLAYLDSVEVPSFINWSQVDGTFEGASGNPGHSSRIQGVISNWGAIGDTAWMKKGDAPVYCVHGTSDSTVRYDSIPAYGPFLFSSKYITMAALREGIPNGLRIFYNAGHELNNDTTKQDSAITDFCAWLYTVVTGNIVAVHQENLSGPASFSLQQNYPNPFNPTTTIRYGLPQRSHVLLTVYNTLGQRVAELVNGDSDAGYHEVQFDGKNLASGVYYYRLQAGSYAETKKLLILR